MYNYPYLEQFYRDNFSILLDHNSSLRPSKSCPKNGAAAIAKFVEFYQRNNSLSFSENEVLRILDAENVNDGDTIFHQNLRVMRELGFVSVASGGSKTYFFTDQFIRFVESNHSVECYILEKLLSISSVDDLTMYFNFLICVMREAAIYGQVIQYKDSAEKFTLDVDDLQKRKEHQERVFKIYGFKGDEARNVPENYTPNISYFCHAVLKQLGILTKSDIKIDNMGTLVLTPLGEMILSKIDDNLHQVQMNRPSSNYKKTPCNQFIQLPLQQIFYGAPGTGKSHYIKENAAVVIAEEKELIFRTTFHPDSDYSTFVGTYKPTMRPVPSEYRAVLGKEEEITYSFVPQAFLQAYVSAWNNTNYNVFLIIEEINRGNCAQIFGDLFQLLDRDDDGYSEYPIKADNDIVKYLNGSDEDGNDILTNKEGIKNGKLRLPKNLFIWATMNTSDQSLFPIDSAFKRRWDWKYTPIANAQKNYVIEIDNDQYDWWSFLEAINAIIESTTHSEDKKLGYFFAKTKGGIISADTFVSKVIFYLWNDVFKDNETSHKAFKDENGELLAFKKFFNKDGSVNTNVVIKFLQDLEVFPFENSEDGSENPINTPSNAKRPRDKSRYNVNGKGGLNKAQMTREAFKLYIEHHSEADSQAIAEAWNGLGLKDYVQHLVETEKEFNARTKDSTDSNKRATKFELVNGEKIYLSTQFGIGNIGRFIDAVNNAGWNIHIDKQE